MNADKPWQCLSACRDLTAALDSPDPAQYRSRLPVHQDGEWMVLQAFEECVSYEVKDYWSID